MASANLADRYISDRFLPDKAIDLVDEAGSRLRIKRMKTLPDYKDIENELAKVVESKKQQGQGDFEEWAACATPRRSCWPARSPRSRRSRTRASTCSTRSTRRPSPR